MAFAGQRRGHTRHQVLMQEWPYSRPSGAVKGGTEALPAGKREDETGNTGFAGNVAAKEALYAATGGFRRG